MSQEIRAAQTEGWRASRAGCRVTVCEHLDGRLTIHYGPHEAAAFLAPGGVGKKMTAGGKRKEQAA